MLQFWIVSFAMLHEHWVSLDNRPAGKLQDLQQKACNLLMLEICFVLAMCFISYVHICRYLLYSHGFSFLTEVTNTALGDLILCCCCCVCVCAHCLPACVCMLVCVCDIPIHINPCTHRHNKHSYMYSLSLYHCHTCITGKHLSCLRYWQTSVTHIFWQTLVCTFCIKTMRNASAKLHKHNRAPYM